MFSLELESKAQHAHAVDNLYMKVFHLDFNSYACTAHYDILSIFGYIIIVILGTHPNHYVSSDSLEVSPRRKTVRNYYYTISCALLEAG